MRELKQMPRTTSWMLWLLAVLVVPFLIVRAMDSSWESRFISSYSSWHGEVDSDTQARLVHGTGLACGLLDEGNDVPDTFNALVDYGYSSDQATSVISGAVVYRCTEYAPLITR